MWLIAERQQLGALGWRTSPLRHTRCTFTHNARQQTFIDCANRMSQDWVLNKVLRSSTHPKGPTQRYVSEWRSCPDKSSTRTVWIFFFLPETKSLMLFPQESFLRPVRSITTVFFGLGFFFGVLLQWCSCTHRAASRKPPLWSFNKLMWN